MIGHSRRRWSVLSPEGLSLYKGINNHDKTGLRLCQWDGCLNKSSLKVMILFLYYISVDFWFYGV